MYIGLYIYIYIYIYICKYEYVYVYVCVCVCTYTLAMHLTNYWCGYLVEVGRTYNLYAHTADLETVSAM